MPALLIRSGPLAGRRVEVDGELVIGRGQADLVIADGELSRRHLAVRPAAGGVEVEDLGSLNGTWVAGERIEAPTVLGGGGGFKAGVTTFEVALPVADFVAAPAPRRRREPATRLWLPSVITFAVLAATALALILYFGLR